jgi:RNA polymerase sigma factor (sigma-70 family)
VLPRGGKPLSTLDLLQRALSRDPASIRALVRELTPVIQMRVARRLLRPQAGPRKPRNVQEEVLDLVQEVFAALFADDARALRAWDPSKGMSLANWVGLLAEREVTAIVRSGRRRPWSEEPTEDAALDRVAGSAEGPEVQVASQQMIERLADKLREELSPRALDLFQRLLVEEQPIDQVCEATGMQRDAVYAWKSRLGKLARKIGSELRDETTDAQLEGRPA